MTLDEYNRYWIDKTSSACDYDALADMAFEAQRSEHWNGKLAKHLCGVMILLRVEDGPYGRVDTEPQQV